MHGAEMVVVIFAIATIGGVIKAMLGVRKDHKGNEFFDHARHRADDQMIEEIKALRREVKALKDRQAVIERITVEKETSLEREFDRLRDEREA